MEVNDKDWDLDLSRQRRGEPYVQEVIKVGQRQRKPAILTVENLRTRSRLDSLESGILSDP